MIPLRYRATFPLIFSGCMTFILHVIFFMGIIFFMTEEYYTVGSGHRHHQRHHRYHGVESSTASVAHAPHVGMIPEPDERFVEHDEETHTYRLSPDLIKALKSLDIVPVITRAHKSQHKYKAEIIKEKAPHQAHKNTGHTVKEAPKKLKHNLTRDERTQPQKKSRHGKNVSVVMQEKIAAQKIAQVVQKDSGKKQGVAYHAAAHGAGTYSQPGVSVKTALPVATASTAAMSANAAPANAVPAKTTSSVSPVVEQQKPMNNQTSRAVIADSCNDDDDVYDQAHSAVDAGDDTEAYDDDSDGEEGGDERAVFDTGTLSLAAAQARGGMLSNYQNHAAKQLSEHLVKQWKPPAGCHDASPVHVEIIVQHDGTIESKIVKTSSMPILNFAVKRMVAQFSSKVVHDMMDRARGTKLVFIFKG